MGKIRSLHAQLNYCITQNTRMGTSKRQFKKENNGKTNGHNFSLKTTECERAAVNSISNFMKEYYPEVRMAKDLNEKHIQSWINHNADNWSKKTIEQHISQAKKIAIQINRTYHTNITFHLHKPEEITVESTRDVAFTREDFNKVHEYLSRGRSQSIKALEITGRCGLRVNEVAHLRTDKINLEKHIIEIREGSKGNKWRDIPIRDKDMDYFKQLKENCETLYVTQGNKPNSLNRGIRRALIDLGLSNKYVKTTEHAIRKMYARERMQEERNKGRKERDAWYTVKDELGHSDDYRPKLYKIYIG